jgi:hypothetical protein
MELVNGTARGRFQATENKKGRCEKIRGALFFNLIEVLLTFFCGGLLCWLLLHKHLRNFQMAGKNTLGPL